MFEFTPVKKSSHHSKAQLLMEFERPKVVQRTQEEIDEGRDDYRDIVASFALEDDEPDDFGKVVAMEEIRGELTFDDAIAIIQRILPNETARIEAKVKRLRELGLSWRDL